MDLNNPAHIGHSQYLISTHGYKAEQVFNEEKVPSEHTEKTLLNIFESHYNEHCGFICTNGIVWEVDNIHHQPHTNFYMDLEQAEQIIRGIYRTGAEILGIWHTHPNSYGWPTPRDICGWPNEELGWRYFLVTRNGVTEWRRIRG